MSEIEYDVVAVGNALVDVHCHASDEILATHNMDKGSMMLIDEQRADDLYTSMKISAESSGGSAANTIAGIAYNGGKGAYIGKVANDDLGRSFTEDFGKLGITHRTAPLENSFGTGRCLIFVTPDAQRTMNTYLGASSELGPKDLDEKIISSSKITYMEGYLFDKAPAKKAFLKAAEIAHAAERKVSLTLSDSFCVDRHREDFLSLIKGHIDILFANEDEIKSLFEEDEFTMALQAIRENCNTAILTRGEKGALIASEENVIEIEAKEVNEVLDTTGAGDQFAAGVLFGITKGLPIETCGHLGATAAAEVISHMGPRPEKNIIGNT